MAFGNDNVRKASEIKMSREERLKQRRSMMTSKVITEENDTKEDISVTETKETVSKENIIVDLDISMIDANEDNSKIFTMVNIDLLADTIEREGFRGAIEVFRKPNGRYEVLSGHRRLAAVKKLGHDRIPAIVSDMPDDMTKSTMLLSSNINNRDLTPADKVRMVSYYYNHVLLQDGWREQRKAEGKNTDRQEACAEFFGYSITNIKRYKALADIDADLQKFLSVEDFPYTAFDGMNSKTSEEQKKVRDGLFKEIQNKVGKKYTDIDEMIEQLEAFPFGHKETLNIIKQSIAGNVESNMNDAGNQSERVTKGVFENLRKNTKRINKEIEKILADYEIISTEEISVLEIDKLILSLNEIKKRIE